MVETQVSHCHLNNADRAHTLWSAPGDCVSGRRETWGTSVLSSCNNNDNSWCDRPLSRHDRIRSRKPQRNELFTLCSRDEMVLDMANSVSAQHPLHLIRWTTFCRLAYFLEKASGYAVRHTQMRSQTATFTTPCLNSHGAAAAGRCGSGANPKCEQ